eukprot:1830825-Pleurochrysis_carterae.AAC.3
MRFHADPGQGEEWGYSTCVVSLGDTRLFTFRKTEAKAERCTVAVREGDVLEMYADCQQQWQHSVRKEAQPDHAVPRVSLVFKRTLQYEKQRLEDGERPDWNEALSRSQNRLVWPNSTAATRKLPPTITSCLSRLAWRVTSIFKVLKAICNLERLRALIEASFAKLLAAWDDALLSLFAPRILRSSTKCNELIIRRCSGRNV